MLYYTVYIHPEEKKETVASADKSLLSEAGTMTSRFVTRSKIGQQIGWVEEVVILFRVCTLVLSLSTHLLFLTFYSVYAITKRKLCFLWKNGCALFSVAAKQKSVESEATSKKSLKANFGR